MIKPTINYINKSEELISDFGGYNKNLKIPENCFYDEENICSDYSPVFSPRNKRRYLMLLVKDFMDCSVNLLWVILIMGFFIIMDKPYLV